MKRLILVLVIFTLVFLSGCGMLLDNFMGEDFDESRLDTSKSDNSGSAPGRVSGVSADSVSGGIEISWNPVSGAVEYKIYRSSSSTGNYVYLNSTIYYTYSDTTAVSGTTYYYKVAAVNSANTEGDLSNAVSGTYTGGSSSLSAPTGLTRTVSGSSVTLTWNSVSNAMSYNVYRGTSVSGTYSQINSYTSIASYTDSPSAAGTYYYKVSAVSSSGSESPLSASVSATVTGGGSSPDTPTGLTPAVSGSSVTLTWNSVSNATSYKVYRSTSASGTYSPINSNNYTSTSYPDSAVSAGTYYYKVSAVSSSGSESLLSASVSATITGGGSLPVKVTGVNVIVVSGGYLVSWTEVSGADSYTVYKSTGSGYYSYTSIPNITNTWYKDSSADGNTRYYVRAVNSVGEGPGSDSDYKTAGTSTLTPLPAEYSSSASWTSSTLSSGVKYYRFQSYSGGKSTTIRWADSDAGASNFSLALTADIKVSAYYEDTGEAIFTGKDEGYSPGETFNGAGRYIIVKVELFTHSGTFCLKYQ
ncbi:MAG: hypothetical protein LBB83_03830 [Treponema sp.]|jgi:fibronectin type 3 domain-containing protein|nr:hypothetical protein [Treponema sp.]